MPNAEHGTAAGFSTPNADEKDRKRRPVSILSFSPRLMIATASKMNLYKIATDDLNKEVFLKMMNLVLTSIIINKLVSFCQEKPEMFSPNAGCREGVRKLVRLFSYLFKRCCIYQECLSSSIWMNLPKCRAGRKCEVD